MHEFWATSLWILNVFATASSSFTFFSLSVSPNTVAQSHLVIHDTQLSILVSSVRLKIAPLPCNCFISCLYLGCCWCVFSTAFDHCPHMANIKMSMYTGNVFNPKEFDFSLYAIRVHGDVFLMPLFIQNLAFHFWCTHTHGTCKKYT